MNERERFWKRTVPHVFELAVALAWALIGLAYLIDPTVIERSPVGRMVHPYDLAWSIGYLIACPLIVTGVLFPRERRLRVAGLAILKTGLVMHGIAALSFDAAPRAFVYFVFAGACLLRIVHLVQLHRAGTREG